MTTTTAPPPRAPKHTTPDPPPPKSKTEPYYSILPSWSDITPIPQADLDNPSTYTNSPPTTLNPSEAQRLSTAGPALATIAYAPRYAEAMSYLRAVMADNEFSERALALTQDIISMNPAHYTVWIYRFKCLRRLWGVDVGDDKEEEGVREKRVTEGVERELKWLEAVSERNLKNYQIWHHRTSLLSLLRTLPPTEQAFLTHILTLDTKNYHVWSYRQWLCTRFPDPLLTTPSDLVATEAMISDDPLNNSAWNHRWYLIFGHRELQPKKDGKAESKVIDLDVVDREVEYAKRWIRVMPQNGSSWNYLRGVIKHASVPVTDLKAFVAEFVGEGWDFFSTSSPSSPPDTNENAKRPVTSSHAIEVAIDIFAAEVAGLQRQEGREAEDAKTKVRAAIGSLSQLWDPIRRNYWGWKLRGLEEGWKADG